MYIYIYIPGLNTAEKGIMADILAVQENVNKLQKVYGGKYQVTWGWPCLPMCCMG